MKWVNKQRGFTIVELMIVIAVIAILAIIVIVGYNGIQDRARTSAVQASLKEANDKIRLANLDTNGSYPTSASAAGIRDTADVTYQYTSDNNASPRTYCLTATYQRTTSYYIKGDGGDMTAGICPGHNLMVWFDAPSATYAPVVGGTIDTSVTFSGVASTKLPPNTLAKRLRIDTVTGVAGQVFTVSFNLKTDSNWNGTSSNSKIRFVSATSNALLKSCAYNSVRTDWTPITCSWTITSADLKIYMTVGNDGTVGNIWLDDIRVTSSL